MYVSQNYEMITKFGHLNWFSVSQSDVCDIKQIPPSMPSIQAKSDELEQNLIIFFTFY